MKIYGLILLGACALFSFTGCSGMLDGLRAESAAVDKEASDQDRDRGDSDYQPSGGSGIADARPRGPSANNNSSYGGNEHRGFGRRLASMDSGSDEDSRTEGPQGRALASSDDGGPAPADYHRARSQDFVDKDASENSLWDGQGQTNFLFAQNRKREPGDLVVGDVEKDLKREIQYQLWLTLPPEQRRPPKRSPASATDGDKKAAEATAAATAATDKAAAAGDKGAVEKNKDAAAEAAKTNMAADGDDTVKMEVAENMGNGLMRMVGQKRVIYRGAARIVEVTALVNNKDIDDTNRVKSSAFLDMKTQVIQ